MTAHLCHAEGCKVPVAPKLLMCGRHWRMVPKRLQRAVWDHYRPGQEVDKHPTSKYLEAAHEAIEYVAQAEALRSGVTDLAHRQRRLL